MSIKSIEEAQGISKRSYARGYVYRCAYCNLWTRWLNDGDMCKSCMKAKGIKETIPFLRTQDAINANNIKE